MRSRRAVLFAVLAFVVVACSGSGAASSDPASVAPASDAPASVAPSAPPETVELTVYGAASLKGVLEKAKAAYEAAVPGTTVLVSTDSSTALATQIEQGAPADVFLSADTKNPQALADKGLIAGDPVPFAGNELTIIVPGDNPAGITSAKDMAKAGIKIIAAGDEVPITKYATQLVANLAKEAGFPTDFAAAYAANVVSKEDNVKNVVAKIITGDGDAGIVYATDAKGAPEVQTVDVPAAANVPATYAGAVVTASAHADAAKAFLAWFAGQEGQAILAEAGFLPPS